MQDLVVRQAGDGPLLLFLNRFPKKHFLRVSLRGTESNGLGVGASYRHIVDLADWDRSVATSTPGQSGQPDSPHYGDLLPLWAEGKYFPLPFSRTAVEAASLNKLVLVPDDTRARQARRT